MSIRFFFLHAIFTPGEPPLALWSATTKTHQIRRLFSPTQNGKRVGGARQSHFGHAAELLPSSVGRELKHPVVSFSTTGQIYLCSAVWSTLIIVCPWSGIPNYRIQTEDPPAQWVSLDGRLFDGKLRPHRFSHVLRRSRTSKKKGSLGGRRQLVLLV